MSSPPASLMIFGTPPFTASIHQNGTRRTLGNYPTAAAAALACARAMHGADASADADGSASATRGARDTTSS